MDKQDIRQKMLSIRAGLSREQVAGKSRRIVRTFLDLPQVGQCSECLIYLPVRKEVDTRPLVQELIVRKKKVYVPRCESITGCSMDFFRITDLGALQSGSFGIDEPCPDPDLRFTGENMALCVLPGLAFDRQGVRLGYGRGFFDRYLAGLAFLRPLLIGFGYAFQIIDRLPEDDWDVPVDLIITEKGVLRTG